MKISENAQLIRIFLGEKDDHEGMPLYEAIVREARRLNLAGATVIRGIAGFGANSRLHLSKYLRLSEDLPIVIEIVDDESKIASLIPFLDKTIKEGLVTVENLKVLKYVSNPKGETK
jgi:uncharacterized protein